jgi:hypothetical protein
LIIAAFGSAFGNQTEGAVPNDYRSYFVQIFVSYWLNRLTETKLKVADRIFSDSWEKGAPPPNGYLVRSIPSRAAVLGIDPRITNDPARYLHPCFLDESQPARHLSSGFRQLRSLIVQAALMQPNEVLAVENPEVHLHPSAQLQVAEFLIEQAKAGKLIIVETHSDLVVRRVLRAIIEEEPTLPQEQVRLYFVNTTEGEGYEGYRHSRLESYRIRDEDGTIENWPEGFMADDIIESRKLFKIMYGVLPENDPQGNEE